MTNTTETKYLAEFDSPEALLEAVAALREAGCDDIEAHTPFPIHGIDEAIGVRQTKLPWLVLGAGVAGCAIAIAMQWWMNAVDYPYIISGKPLFSFPASIPIAFELTILFAAFAAFFGMLQLIRLPRLYNPLLEQEAMRRATSDRFVLAVAADGSKEAEDNTLGVIERTGALRTETITLQPASGRLPRYIPVTLAVMASLAILPPLYILRARVTKSEKPPLAWFSDMDYQPKFKAQSRAPLFADNRAMRPIPAGVVARGDYFEEDAIVTGRDSGTAAVARENQADGSPSIDPAAPTPALEEAENFVDEIPISVSDELMAKGRKYYNINCAVCHGRAGYGNGPVSVRALSLEQGTWVPPSSLHAPPVREQPQGQLYNTITHGIRKMPGYGDHLTVEQRWAIVLYVRALQRSQNATPNDVRSNELPTLRELK